jgi:hypothetical protein
MIQAQSLPSGSSEENDVATCIVSHLSRLCSRQRSCERLLTLSSGIYRYAEFASEITSEHFSSKRLSAKDRDRGFLRRSKIDE